MLQNVLQIEDFRSYRSCNSMALFFNETEVFAKFWNYVEYIDKLITNCGKIIHCLLEFLFFCREIAGLLIIIAWLGLSWLIRHKR